MTLYEMSAEYGKSAELIRTRTEELRARLAGSRLCETERLRLRTRIERLDAIYRELRGTELLLMHYYDGGYRRGGPKKRRQRRV